MFNFETFKQKSPQQRFLFILGLVMFLFYMVLGALLIVGTVALAQIQPKYRIMLGVVLVVYAVIRFLRVIKQRPEEEQ
jgi:membrane protein implicated in regulation of membrane protease activity